MLLTIIFLGTLAFSLPKETVSHISYRIDNRSTLNRPQGTSTEIITYGHQNHQPWLLTIGHKALAQKL